MATLRTFLSGLAKRWADRRVARQAEIEDFVGVEEPKALPETEADHRRGESPRSSDSDRAGPERSA